MNDRPTTRPDPVAMLRDQLARLGRGESAPEVGGVTHVVTQRRPRPPGDEDDVVDADDAGGGIEPADGREEIDDAGGAEAVTKVEPDAGPASAIEPGPQVESEPRVEPEPQVEPEPPSAARRDREPSPGPTVARPDLARPAVARAAVADRFAGRAYDVVLGDVASLLAVVGVPGWVARAAVDALGATAAQRLAADPWALLEVPGIAPEQADLFARGEAGAQQWEADDARRVRALVLWLLRRAARRGDTAIRARDARAALAGFGVADPDVALRAILAEGRVMAFAATAPTADEPELGADPEESMDDFDGDDDGDFEEPDELNAAGGVLLALDDHALAEEAIAEAVVRLLSTAQEWPDLGTGRLERALAGNGVVLYAAGPGEEPPSALAAAAASARAAGLRVVVVAPTADGRDRIGGDALTLAELAARERGPDDTFELDLLVVTDATLLDAGAAAAVLEAVPDGARVVLAGDPAGIESAGPGRVFTDLAAGGTIRTLVAPAPPTEPLDILADAIRDGRLPPIRDPERRVVLVPAGSDEEAAHRCAQLVADSIPRVIGIAAEQVLVVSPFAAGPAGADALNAALKARMRPAGGPGVEPGDPVIAANPGPGGGVRLGTLHAVLDDGRVTVAFGRAEPEALPRAAVRPGWALTARQAMGVRRPAAVAVLPAAGADAYTRALVYTLLTRGSRHVSIVHAAGPALARAVAAEPTGQRLTHLPQALREASG